ncbi:MAG: hypothetical protein ABIR62_10910 [Dokdonella sp.]|uniref:hypothetical protein n=1 Tax=Dokdonella sp. TaxID=2291710 RepID=UPI003267D7CC
MARIKSVEGNARRMLSLWQPPVHAGTPIGVLATTFTLDTALFEEECLARFADVQSDPRRDGALYRIEREEKLASLLCAAVVADIHHAAGRRSLRWDLLAARPASGVMHAKISLLVWHDLVRVIVASANLSVDGYRRNQETATVLEFDRRSADRMLLDPLLEYLRGIVGLCRGVATQRAYLLLDWVTENLPQTTAPGRGLQRRLILLGPDHKNLFDQLDEYLPAQRPETADVVSPFFDESLRSTGPEHRLWSMLRQRGDARLRLHVAGEYAAETGRWRLQVPSDVRSSEPSGRDGAVLSLHPIPVSGVPTESGPERRPLHAKMLTLCHPGWAAWLVGSSNFTSAGTGLAPYRRNYEANVLHFVRAGHDDALYRQLETGGLRGGAAIATEAPVDFAPAFDADDSEGGGPPPLPAFFAEAELRAGAQDHYVLGLQFAAGASPAAWSVRRDSETLYDRQRWDNDGQADAIEILLTKQGPPPSLLQVEWRDAADALCTVDWPVNVQAADALPAPQELHGLTLTALLELLSSARPLHEVMRDWLRRQPDDDDSDGLQGVELVDPHKKVDTSSFLIKRVRRACGALQALRQSLERPVLSEAALAWRLHGPVGAIAVVEAIQRQSDPALPDEWAFLLLELVCELAAVRLMQATGQPAPAALQAKLDLFVGSLRGRLDLALREASESLRAYAEAAMKESDLVLA